MKKLPTANKLIRENNTLVLHKVEYVSYKETRALMIEFAKLHVERALKEASEKATGSEYMEGEYDVNKNSILNSYQLSNIK